MQNAKDTFYITLRNRLAALNPYRTVVVRGVERPGILVEENEVAAPQMQPDVFVLRWTALSTEPAQGTGAAAGPLPGDLAQMTCEILYLTRGTVAANGMDRGRMLAAMDAELAAILAPPRAPETDYTATPPAEAPGAIFWTAPAFAPAATVRNQLSRTARVTVWSRQTPEGQ